MERLKIAVQKSGRLHANSLALLKSCGIFIENKKEQLKVTSAHFPLDILYLRNSDIPRYLEDGVVDAAMIGENILLEKQVKVKIIKKLGFAQCKVCLAVPKSEGWVEMDYFQGKKIATSYPNTLKKYLQKNNIKADIHVISGAVEIAPNIGLSDAICDIVSSGATLSKNGLRAVKTLFESQAVLASNISINKQKQILLEKLTFRIQAVLAAQNTQYILMNIPNEKIESVKSILPVLKSPTIVPLAQKGWSSLHSVVQENIFWQVIDDLKSLGAEGILVMPIDKIVL